MRLSTKYGIITEYTSFLIREDVNLRDHKANAEKAGREVDKLKKDTGVAGASQAGERARLGKAAQAPSAAPGEKNFYADLDGKQVEVRTVQNVGRRTFYQRNNVWQEADLSEKEEATTVKYFSDDFFKLLEDNPELNQIAVLDADVIVRVGARNYRLAK